MSGTYSVRGVIIRVIILLILIASLLFLGFFVASRVGFFQLDGFFGHVGRSLGIEPTESVVSVTDPRMVEYDRQRSERQRLEEWEVALKQKEAQINQEQQNLDKRVTEIEAKEKDLQEKEENIKKITQMYENIGGGLRTTAESLVNMPPEKAIEILLNMEDPAVINVLNMVNSLAKQQNTTSLVPVWLQMMPPERSASIVKKMALT